MSFSLITESPAWFSLLCLLAGAFYAWLMYRKASINNEVPHWQKRVMPALRFLLVSLLCFLLLSPMIRTLTREVEKPIILLAMDASQSIINSKDSTQIKETYKSAIEKIEKELKSDFEVRTYSFGDHVRDNSDFSFGDKETNFSTLYDELDIKYSNRNVGALVIASDGLYNDGENPVYGPERLKIPVYTLALGDTSVRKDLVIAKLNNNKLAFLGNSFPVEVIIDARQSSGSKAVLTVEEDSVQLFSRGIDIAGNRFHTTVPVMLDAKKKGIHHYVFRVSSLPGEVTYSNNIKDVFIEVVENKQKILILAATPNPDLSVLKNAIETSPNYDVSINDPSTFDGRFADYSMLILHSIPSANQNTAALIDKIKNANINTWYILGASTNIPAFNSLGTGVEISQSNEKLNDALSIAVSEFSMFNLSNELKEEISAWPPLKSPFGVYNTNGNIYPVMYQKLGNVSTRQPQFYFSEKDGKKVAVLCGEGLWRWWLSDFNSHSNHDLSTEIISKTIQYLCVRENRSPFRIITKNNFKENEALIFDAELYNQSEQLVNDPEARLTIYNSAGKQFPYTFTRTEKAYTLNTGIFPVGNYRYKAEVKLGDKLYAQQGEFSVSALQLESSNTVADFQMLNTLSSRSGAAMFLPSAADQLIKAIKDREDVKSVSFTHKKLEDFVNLPWIFFLLVTLLSLEWFLRKRAGSY